MDAGSTVEAIWLILDRYHDSRGTLDEIVVVFRTLEGLYDFTKLPAQPDHLIEGATNAMYGMYKHAWGAPCWQYRVTGYLDVKRITIKPALVLVKSGLSTAFIWGGEVKILNKVPQPQNAPWVHLCNKKNNQYASHKKYASGVY